MVAEILAQAREEAPNECCGIIGGTDGRAATLYRARNALRSPLRYDIDSHDLLRIINELDAAGEDLLAIYHSHTASPAAPSQTDINLAQYPDSIYIIVSLEDEANPDVRAYWIRDGRVEDAELVIQ